MTEPEIGARAATSLANLMVISGRPQLGAAWAQRAVDATTGGSSLRAMARTAQAYALAVSGNTTDGLQALGFLAAAGNEASISRPTR